MQDIVCSILIEWDPERLSDVSLRCSTDHSRPHSINLDQTIFVTLKLSSRSRKIDVGTPRGQGHIFAKYQDNRSSGLGGVWKQTNKQRSQANYKIDYIAGKESLVVLQIVNKFRAFGWC